MCLLKILAVKWCKIMAILNMKLKIASHGKLQTSWCKTDLKNEIIMLVPTDCWDNKTSKFSYTIKCVP